MKTSEITFMALVLLAIGLLVINAKIYTDKGVECIQNPMVFGARELSESNLADFSCTCTLDKPRTPTVYINQYNITVESRKGTGRRLVINFTQLDETLKK